MQAVLFDLDGTLLDTGELIKVGFRIVTQKVLGEVIPDEILLEKVGQPLDVQMECLSPAHAPELIEEFRLYIRDEHDALVAAFPGTKETLISLRNKGVLLGVVTSKQHELAQRGLSICGIDSFFDVLVGSDDLRAHKPDPGPVLYAASCMNVPVGECLFVGDSPFDMQAGAAAGAVTVAAMWGMFRREIIIAQTPQFIAEAITDVPKIYETLQG